MWYNFNMMNGTLKLSAIAMSPGKIRQNKF